MSTDHNICFHDEIRKTSILFGKKKTISSGTVLFVLFCFVLCAVKVQDLGPVILSVVSLRSLLVVKMLTILVSTISNS